MKTVILLIIILALGAAGWFGLGRAQEAGLVAQLELLAREKLGLVDNLGNCVPVVMNRGVFKEIPGEEFPFSQPATMKPPVGAICRFADPNVSFHLNPVEAGGTIAVFRRPPGIAVLELVDGAFSISALTLGVEWWLPTVSLTLRSKNEATVVISKTQEALSLMVISGSIDAALNPRPGKRSPAPLRIQTMPNGSFTVGDFELAGGELGEWLPSGFRKIELPKAPLPPPPAHTP